MSTSTLAVDPASADGARVRQALRASVGLILAATPRLLFGFSFWLMAFVMFWSIVGVIGCGAFFFWSFALYYKEVPPAWLLLLVWTVVGPLLVVSLVKNDRISDWGQYVIDGPPSIWEAIDHLQTSRAKRAYRNQPEDGRV